MISQIFLLSLLGVSIGHPQTFQYQRDLVYNPPLHVPVNVVPSSAHGLPLVQQNHLLAKAEPQPAVYLHQGAPTYLQSLPQVYAYRPNNGGVVLLSPQEPSVFENFYNWLQQQASSFNIPLFPTPTTTSATPTANTDNPKKPDQEEVSGGKPANVPSPSQKFFLGQPLPVASVYPFPSNQFLYRQRPAKVFDQADIQGDKAGQAALSFQKYLAVAKLKSKVVRGGAPEENDEPAEDDTASEVTTTEKEDTETIDNQELGPSIAQAKPQAVSVAGPGGVAAAAPVGTAVVGPGGMALSAPSATAVAGAKGTRPGASSSKIRAYFKQANVPGYFVQY